MAPGPGSEVKYCCGGFDPDDIVISGMAGRFPEAETVGELSEGLYSGKEFIISSERRWEKGAMGLMHSNGGLLKDISKFDADFFGFAASNAHDSDPNQRMLLQVSYEAIADAGYDPQDLKGRNIGVYNATTETEAKEIRQKDPLKSKNCSGYLRCMNANRISYFFDFHGPSICMDTACSSSAVALHLAFNDLREGRCDAALVTGCQLLLSPELSALYSASGITSPTGKCSPFDAICSGMARSEAIAAIFIQKAFEARRVYATIANMKSHTAGYVPEGIYVPSMKSQVYLYNETFREIGLAHSEIDYIEAHGTGTVVGDPIELNSIASVFCKGRKTPLYVGTIKSNIGHTEPTAGICGVIKAILAFETGMIAPNNNYNTPNPACEALIRGDLRVLIKPMPQTSTYIPVNSFGFGGANAHIILKKNPIEYSEMPTAKKVPILLLYPATTEEAVQSLFDYVHKNPVKDGLVSLLNNLSFTSTLYKPYRGYTILKENNEACISEIKYCVQRKTSIWYIMTGMGCQWSGMGLSMMQFDVFAESMRKSAKVLEPFGIDLLELLRADKNYLQQDRIITPAFVAISAIQIALIDLLKTLGIEPDGIVGHSTGELACAYADGCCTAEQTILSAYYRGKAVETENLPCGAMAAVGLTWKEALERCPANVYPACHNADDSITISGLKEPLEKFVEELKTEKVFARIVNAYGYAFHCRLVQPSADTLKTVLKEIIPNPKPRSARWLSSSYPESEWEELDCKMANPNYFVHNLVSCVHFNEVLKKIPPGAITIEIGPHFLLQSILKRAIGPNAAYIGLMKRNQDNVDFLLQSIGKLYTLGLDPQIKNLYPATTYPVPRATPCISDLIKWDHSVSWKVPKWKTSNGSVRISVKPDKADTYLMDHCIEGRSLFPATGYIHLAWEALSIRQNRNMAEMAITVENFKIHHAIILSTSEHTEFYVSFLNASGDFEIVESNSVVSTGRITSSTKQICTYAAPEYTRRDNTSVIAGEDIYNELKIYGYEYGPAFQGLLEMNIDGREGLVAWNDRWIPYLDSLLLFFGMVHTCHIFPLPTGILSLKIDPRVLKETVVKRESQGLSGLPVSFNPYTQRCLSAGVEITKLKVEPAPHRFSSDDVPTLEEYTFISYVEPSAISEDQTKKCYQYMYACDKMVENITRSLGHKRWNHIECTTAMIQDFKVEDYIIDATEEHALLMALKKISALSVNNQIIQNRKEIFQAYVENIKNDIMYNTLLSEKPIRIALDIITENSYRKLNVLEMHRGLSIVSPIASKIMNRHNHRNFTKCIVVSSDSKSLDKEALADLNIQLENESIMNNLSSSDKNQDIVISSFLSGNYKEFHSHVKTLSAVSKSGGFILLLSKSQMHPAEKFLYTLCNEEIPVYSEMELERILHQEGLLIVSKLSDSFGSSLYLLRNVPATLNSTNKIVHLAEDKFESWITELKTAITNSSSDFERIWLVSEDSAINGVVGLINCLRQEPGGEKIRCVFILSSKSSKEKLPSFSFKEPFYADILKKDLLMNIYKDGSWGSFRHLSIDDAKKPQVVEHSNLNCAKYGDLSSFQWFESPLKYQSSSANEKALVHIYYAPLNFKDVMLATGKLSLGSQMDSSGDNDCVLGIEYSGKKSSGQRVMGFVYNRALATTLYAEEFIYDVPDHWSLEEAATVPVVYSTCYFALIIRGQLKRGESILIHSGTGGIGQAAITIALNLDCEIFTTVGSESKKKYLKKKFPQIKDENIGCSRDVSFEDLIMMQTEGKGVNVVLNSLADDKFKASLRCLKKHGRFLEIGKYDLVKDNPIGLGVFVEDVSFHGVCLDKLYTKNEENERTLRDIKRHVVEGIKSGVVKPLDRTVFQKNEAEKAFRYMAGGTHVGKVMLKIRDEEPDKCAIPKMMKLEATPITYFYRHKVYIIIGGLGGFGIELAKWLIKKGARKIVLTSRYGARTPYHHLCLERWKTEGAHVVVSTLNVAKKNEAKKLLQDVSILGPVGGIFNSALVLNDAFMENQTPQYFEEVCAPKATATKHLDELSRGLCPSLDYFVCMSSISCGKGNAGQTNYGYANSVMERICEQRHNMGLHGLAIQWGIIGDVGIVHRHVGDDAMIAGVRAQSAKSCLDTLDTFCRLQLPVVSSYVNADTMKSKANQGDVLSQLAKIFGFNDPSEFNVNRSFSEMGMDSMIGVEVKHLLETYSGTPLSIQELRDMKIENVKGLVEKVESSKKNEKSLSHTLVTTSNVSFPKSFVASTTIVPLNAKMHGTPRFVICFGDNDVCQLTELAEAVSITMFAVQCTKDTPMTDIQTIAKWHLQEINKVLGYGAVHLIGYKLGMGLALEMVLQSKNMVQVKSLSFLDGSWNFVKALDAQDDSANDDISHLTDFVMQFIPNGMPKLKSELALKENLEQQITTVANALLKSSTQPVDKSELMDAMYAYLKRKSMTLSYTPNGCIDNDIIIIEPSSQLLANEVSVVKSVLSKVTTGKITIHRIPGSNNFWSEKESITKAASLFKKYFN